MKIIYITSARIPTVKAHGYQICKMCEEFSEQGIEVELWLPVRVGDLKDDLFSFYGLKDNFKIKKIKSVDWEYLGRLNFWLRGFCFMMQLLFIKADNSAIIYTRDVEISWIFVLRGYRVVFEAHAWPEKKKWLYEFFIKKVKKIVVITKGLESFFLEAGLNQENVLVAPDGVDLNKFDIDLNRTQAREKLNLPFNKKIILYTGHLYGWKGADDLAEAANLLSFDCLVILVGGVESDFAIFKKKFKDLVDKGKIAVFRQQRHELIPLWLKAADILVLPNKADKNISKYFTSPLKLFEYLASKRPVVASDLPSLREILDENNAIFFEPNNSQSLALAINKLIQNNNLAERLAKQAWLDAKKYSWSERARKIISFIK